MEKYLILSSTSTGYRLFSLSEREVSVHGFRKRLKYSSKNPVIGDIVTLDESSFIDKIEERKSFLSRPRLSNADEVFILQSAKSPEFSSYLADKFLTMVFSSFIKASLVITKYDLLSDEERDGIEKILDEYRSYNIDVYRVNCKDKDKFDFSLLLKAIKGKMVAFIGQTGVGKSTLLNAIDDNFQRKVDSLFISSGRGRHTTKEVILLPYEDGFLFDTPGFSSLDLINVTPEMLEQHFPGFDTIDRCQFSDCKHLENSKGCNIIKSIPDKISKEHYSNYLKLYEEVKENEIWKKRE